MSGWRQRAACRGMDREVFFSDDKKTTARAVRVCLGCPVKVECRESALRSGDHFGVFGAMTGDERRAEARRRLQPAVGEPACAQPVLTGPRRGQSATGTEVGYQRHLRASERPCDACQEAGTAHVSRIKSKSA